MLYVCVQSRLKALLKVGCDEDARVRDKVMPAYQYIGPAGGFALAMMRADFDLAATAMAAGDTAAMMRAYEVLRGYKL